ncbi:M42 family metallopeptidase [Aneurinibacillus sp. Ricciae_BoGa-3]|uniref:M42 family metallopeptidase n=1 Tax=Aneurinibacillus sp. Ricciae_BoGa-3 TaxID=3022697 RepID=UPI00233FA906|nr:M42 family metallopeptidase [Aneurinibacillus sp. Ricciae_BoGa-3]WCK53752.1 M42 family metallopeptidase [Aneurinibacillus sp. Ricciae_BoGa-3]
MEQHVSMYKELTETPGVPGHEGKVREVMKKYIAPFADEITTDNLGSLIARKGNKGPKIMVAGHLDEVGFMITMITDKGFLKFQTLGGWWGQVMLAQRVAIQTRKGVIEGVIGSVPPHILPPDQRKKTVEIKDMFIDIGASSKEEAEEFGIRPGDTAVPICPFTVMNNPKIMMAKAWDNRVGIAMAIQTLESLKGVDHPNTVYGVGNVQEEVGLRGAQTSVNVVQPDIAIAVDVGIAGDTPGVKEQDAQSKIGEGPQILLYDASMIPHEGLRNLVIDTAKEHNIPFQYDAMAGGGTDAGKMHLHGKGVPSIVISIATRYIHSHAAILHQDDIDNAVKLIHEVIKKLDEETVAKLKRGEY